MWANSSTNYFDRNIVEARNTKELAVRFVLIFTLFLPLPSPPHDHLCHRPRAD